MYCASTLHFEQPTLPELLAMRSPGSTNIKYVVNLRVKLLTKKENTLDLDYVE